MAIQTLINGESGLVIRTKINDNFAELEADKVEKVGGDDIEITDASKGIILKLGSNRHRLNLASDGGTVILQISDPL